MNAQQSNLPTWLVSELVDRGATVVTRSETVAELHDRLRRKQGIEWDGASQTWIER